MNDQRVSRPVAAHQFVPTGIGSWFTHGLYLMRRSAAPLLVLALVAAATDAVDLLNQMTPAGTVDDGLWFGSSGIGVGVARSIVTDDADWSTQLWALAAYVVRGLFYSAAMVVMIRLASRDVTSVLDGLSVAVRRLLPLLGWAMVAVVTTSVGLILFLAPGIYVLVVVASTLIAVVTLEERGIRRCFELVLGRFWSTAARLVLITLIGQAMWLAANTILFATAEHSLVSVLLFTVLSVPGFVFTAGFLAATYAELRFYDDRRAEDRPAPEASSGSQDHGDDRSDAFGERSSTIAVLLAMLVGVVAFGALIVFAVTGLVQAIAHGPGSGLTTGTSTSVEGTGSPVAVAPGPTAPEIVASMLARSRRDGAGMFHVSSPAIEDSDTASDGWFTYHGNAVSVETNGMFLGFPTAAAVQDGRRWVKVPDPSTLPPGKSWIECPPIGSDDNGRDLPYRYCVMAWWAQEYADPAGLLSRAGASVTLVSSIPDALGATPATRHQLRIDWAEAATRQTDPEWREWFELRAEMKGVETINLWLDAQSRPLQRTAGEDLELAEAVGAVTYSDWGRNSSITVPPSDQIA